MHRAKLITAPFLNRNNFNLKENKRTSVWGVIVSKLRNCFGTVCSRSLVFCLNGFIKQTREPLLNTSNSAVFLIPCGLRSSLLLSCILRLKCASWEQLGLGGRLPRPSAEGSCRSGQPRARPPCRVPTFSNVGVHVQLGEVGGRPHEHAAPSLQPALLVREAEGLHELVDVDAAILVAVNGDGQVWDGLVRDLHFQVDAQQLPGLPEVLHADEAWGWWRRI